SSKSQDFPFVAYATASSQFHCVHLNPPNMSMRVTILGVNCHGHSLDRLQENLIQMSDVRLSLLDSLDIKAIQVIQNNGNGKRKNEQNRTRSLVIHRDQTSCSAGAEEIQQIKSNTISPYSEYVPFSCQCNGNRECAGIYQEPNGRDTADR